MTAHPQRTDSRTPAPGGTAKRAGRTVARVGFGVMQLGRQPRDPSLAILRQALPAGIACVQNSYSVLDRTAEPVLDVCRAHDIAWVPFFPLGSASYRAVRSVTSDPTVTAIASELAVTPAQVALAWLLAHYAGTLLIPGTATPAHLAENIAAGSVRLPPAATATLDGLDR